MQKTQPQTDEPTNPPPTATLLLTEPEAAKLLNLSPRKLWELAARGTIPFLKIGAVKRYRRADLEAWVARGCPAASTPKAAENGAIAGRKQKPTCSPDPKYCPDGELPKVLDTPDFRKAWAEWLDYRRAKKKPVSKKAVPRQLKQLASYGERGAIASIEDSIRNDYQGLFAPKGGSKNGLPNDAGDFDPAANHPTARRPTRDDEGPGAT
jgi:excisionase family DNA binding protein